MTYFVGMVCVAMLLSVGGISVSFAQSGFENPGTRGAGGGGLVPVDDQVDGGTISIGSTAQVVVLFRNESGSPVNMGAINLYPSSNATASVTMNQCGQEPLAGGADCAIAVSVKGLQAGPWRVAMLMRHDGRSRLVSAVLSGVVESSADGANQVISDLEAVPAALEYGSLSASRAQLKSVTLRNITSNPIKILDIFLKAEPSAGLSYETDCEILKAGEACVVATKWSPQQKGPASGVLVIKHDGPTGVATVDINGEYTPEASAEADIFPDAVPGKGLMISSLSEIDFGSDIDTISAITTSLVNSGDADLTIDDITLSGSENGLSIETAGCGNGTVLEPLDACPLTLSWAPVRAGALLDDVKIKHSGARGVLVIPVRGAAVSAVSKDSQSIILNTATVIDSSSPGFSLDRSDETSEETPPKAGARTNYDLEATPSEPLMVNKAKVFDGYSITSLAADRAIITSPRGSRVIFNKEPLTIAGVSWVPYIQYGGVEFHSGADKVLMLFDRSLSSFNPSSAQSKSGDTAGASSE
ncbi:MAG: hypothetical protein H6857_04105 [Rhodospirillales bacterium]|nr:hypothetical protein [Rhodospirillales bacterium]